MYYNFSRISQLPPLYEFANQQLCVQLSASFLFCPNLYERFSIAKPSPQVFFLSKPEWPRVNHVWDFLLVNIHAKQPSEWVFSVHVTSVRFLQIE